MTNIEEFAAKLKVALRGEESDYLGMISVAYAVELIDEILDEEDKND